MAALEEMKRALRIEDGGAVVKHPLQQRGDKSELFGGNHIGAGGGGGEAGGGATAVVGVGFNCAGGASTGDSSSGSLSQDTSL